MSKTKEEIHREIDDWFASPEYKAIRLWQDRQKEVLGKVEELTKECKNDYDLVMFYNSKKTWFGGGCFFCCELSKICKRGKRKEVFKEKQEGIDT